MGQEGENVLMEEKMKRSRDRQIPATFGGMLGAVPGMLAEA